MNRSALFHPARIVLMICGGNGGLLPRLEAAPGGLDSHAAPLELRADARVVVAARQADGRVVVGGDFWWLNGTTVPGLARLETTGLRDPGFVPAIGLMMEEGLESLGNHNGGVDWPAATLLPLPDGRMWMEVRRRDSLWTVLGPQGQVSLGALAALPTGIGTQVHAEGTAPGQLVVGIISRVYSTSPAGPIPPKAEVRAVSLEDGQTLWSHTRTTGPQPLRAWPTGDGHWWVAGEDDAVVDPDVPFSVPGTAKLVWRIKGDGIRDETFTALPFPRGYSQRFQPLPEGKLAVLETDQRSLGYWPPSGSLPVRSRVFMPDGAGLSFNAGSQGRLLELRVEGTPDGALLTNLDTDPARLRRMAQNGAVDPGFSPVRYPAGSAWMSMADGRMIVGTGRYLADGLPDPSWQTPEARRPARMRKLAPAPGGGIYAAGDFVSINGQARSRIVRLDRSGAPDPGFQLDPLVAGLIMDIQSLADGRLFVLEKRELAPYPASPTRLIRLLATGMMDPDFAPFEGLVGSSAVGEVGGMAVFPEGSVLVWSSNRWAEVSNAAWRSLTARGEVEAGFTIIGGGGTVGPVLPDGRFWIGGQRYLRNGVKDGVVPGLPANNYGIGSISAPIPCLLDDGRIVFHVSGVGLRALLPSGGWDETFELPLPSGARVEQLRPDGHGGLLTRYYVPGDSLRVIPLVRRLRGDGRPDPAFRCAPVDKQPLPEGMVTQVMSQMGLLNTAQNNYGDLKSLADLLAVPDGLWIAGNFTQVDARRRDGLVRLSTAMAAGYAGWAEAVFSASPPAASAQAGPGDPDGDGIPNALEYATGGDPLLADASNSQLRLVSITPLVLSLPRNPDAPEMVPALEVGGNLNNWQTVAEADVLRTMNEQSIRFEVRTPAAGRFFRIRFTAAP